jgi:hypothetical protein
MAQGQEKNTRSIEQRFMVDLRRPSSWWLVKRAKSRIMGEERHEKLGQSIGMSGTI